MFLLWQIMALIREVKCSVMEGICFVETWIMDTPYKKRSGRFRSQFPGVSVASKSTVYQLVNKFQTTGFFLKEKQEQA